MKKKSLKFLVILVLFIIVLVGHKVSIYALEEQYASIAAEQLTNDNSYALLKSHNSIVSIYNLIYYVLYSLLGLLSFFTWKEKL